MHPLSRVQERLLYAEQLEPGAADNNVLQLYRIAGPLDEAALRLALADVVARHPVLRTVYAWNEDLAPVQRILDSFAVDLEPAAGPDVADWWETPFDLESTPPVRAGLGHAEGGHLLALGVHHIALDGWSEGVLRRDLTTAYAARVAGTAPGWEPVEGYDAYVRWERERLAGWAARELPFWHKLLRNPPPPLLPVAADPGEAISRNHAVELPADTLINRGRELGANPLSVLLHGVARTLADLFGGERMWLGALSSGRFEPRFHRVVGCFVNPIVVPVAAADDLAAVTRSVIGCLRRSHTPIDELVRSLRAAGLPGPEFQVLVALHDRSISDTPVRFEPVITHPPRTSLDLFIEAIPRPDNGWLLTARWRDDVIDVPLGQAVVDGRAKRLVVS